MRTIELNFFGYLFDVNDIPNVSGIYCVYRCVNDKRNNRIIFSEILYIGESEDINDRISNHERMPDWERNLGYGETLCYSYAPINARDRERAEAALIFFYKPMLNEQHVFFFGYPETAINTCGKNILIERPFWIDNAEKCYC